MDPWALATLALILLAMPGLMLRSRPPRASDPPSPEMGRGLQLLHRLFRLYCGLWHGLRIEGWAPLPVTGPAILISNHTCGIDHMLLQSASRRLLGFLVAREYYESRWLNGICSYIGCIPVNRDGRDVTAIRAALRALGQGRVLPIFPEGRILPESGRRLGGMRPGSAYLAIRAGVPVIPAYIAGTPETDEILQSLVTPSRARVLFGDPIDLSDIAPHQAGDKSMQALVSARFERAFLDLQARAIASEDGRS